MLKRAGSRNCTVARPRTGARDLAIASWAVSVFRAVLGSAFVAFLGHSITFEQHRGCDARLIATGLREGALGSRADRALRVLDVSPVAAVVCAATLGESAVARPVQRLPTRVEPRAL